MIGIKDGMTDKRWIGLCVALLLILPVNTAMAAPRYTTAGEAEIPQTAFTSIEAVDITADTKVFSVGTDLVFSPSGSAVTLMSAYIVAERVDMTASVTVSADLSSLAQDARRLGIYSGEVWTVGDLVAAMLLYGAQDAALILSQHVAGTQAAFVEEMNQRAQALGMENTRYTNAYGAYDETQTTTAADLLSLATAVYQEEALRELLSMQSYQPEGKSRFDNRLRLMRPENSRYDPRVTGMGMGSTSQSGTNLILSASLEGREVLFALHSPASDSSSFEAQASALLDTVFENYFLVDCTEAAARAALNIQLSGVTRLEPQEEIYALAERRTTEEIEAGGGDFSLRIERENSGAALGEWAADALLVYAGEPIASVRLLAAAVQTIGAELEGPTVPVTAPSKNPANSAPSFDETPFYTDQDWQPAPKDTFWERYDWLIIIIGSATFFACVVWAAIYVRKKLR